ncbi:hypothetical protein [Streptomyces blattellae]|uniref:hypothetical protein n=1 Tax=Streptomyces blattellae TaxID=2569855 RepID=UPI0012B7A473|nr:hypothetical protein [Streptomyces blattellae]
MTVYQRRGQTPPAARTGFLSKSLTYYRRCYRRYRTPGTPVPPRARARQALIRLGLRRTYGMLRFTSAMCRRAVRQSSRLVRQARATALRLRYRIQPRLPLFPTATRRLTPGTAAAPVVPLAEQTPALTR